MYDMMFFAKFQCFANIDSQRDDVPQAHIMLLHILRQRGEQFHSNLNGPPDSVFFRQDHVVFVAYNIAMAFQLRHQLEFFYNFLSHTCIVVADICL